MPVIFPLLLFFMLVFLILLRSLVLLLFLRRERIVAEALSVRIAYEIVRFADLQDRIRHQLVEGVTE